MPSGGDRVCYPGCVPLVAALPLMVAGCLDFSIFAPASDGSGGQDLFRVFDLGPPAPDLAPPPPFAPPASFPVGGGPAGIAMGDFDGDGHADVVTADNGANRASAFIGWQSGVFRTQMPATAANLPIAVFAGDLDADGRSDISIANLGSGTVTVYFSDDM